MPTDPASRFLALLREALDEIDTGAVGAAVDLLLGAVARGGTIYVAGNGGSAATAAHFVVDLSAAGAPRVRSLTENVARLTALANDRGFAEVFSLQLAPEARPGDVLVVFSGSGESENVVRAARTAHACGAAVVGFLGFGGGATAALVDLAVTIDSRDYAVVESVHNALEHLVAGWLRRRLGNTE